MWRCVGGVPVLQQAVYRAGQAHWYRCVSLSPFVTVSTPDGDLFRLSQVMKRELRCSKKLRCSSTVVQRLVH